MALVTCAECGGDVSDRARTCPHCGVATGPRSGVEWLPSIAVRALLVFVLITWPRFSDLRFLRLGVSRVDEAASLEHLTNEGRLALWQKVRQSSVRITAYYRGGSATLGSGFVIQRSGSRVLIATNAHVVETAKWGLAREIRVESAVSGDPLPARPVRIVADSDWLDYAFLEAEDSLGVLGQPVRIGPAVRPGSYVVAVGNPLGEEFLTDEGTVREVRRTANGRLIFHTALVEHGSSGGGLFNAAGELVGINTALVGDQRTGVAIFGDAIAEEAGLRF